MVVARRDFDPATFEPDAPHLDDIHDLTLLAMVGIVDPPRAEAKVAIEQCHRAGIEVRMITGDHAVTAAAIGHELGIPGKALTGTEFAAMSDDQLIAELDEIGVVARVSPEDKIRLVATLQAQSNIVAMTGDGVNDAPALKKADIGVAMGITGTEVSKDAAVMILTDDNFATIVRAVEYGRQLYDNLAKYIRFQMAALVAFIVTYLGAALFNIADGIPFAPLAVLWINFAVQVPLALALGFDRPVEGLMDKPPRPLAEPVLSRLQWGYDILLGALAAIGTLWVLDVFEDWENPIVAASMAVAAFSLMNVALAIGARSATQTALDRDTISGRRQLMLYGLALLFTLLSTELGILQRILGTTSLTGGQWLVCIALATALLLVSELVKLVLRHRSPHTAPAKPARAGPRSPHGDRVRLSPPAQAESRSRRPTQPRLRPDQRISEDGGHDMAILLDSSSRPRSWCCSSSAAVPGRGPGSRRRCLGRRRRRRSRTHRLARRPRTRRPMRPTRRPPRPPSWRRHRLQIRRRRRRRTTTTAVHRGGHGSWPRSPWPLW